MHNVLFLHHFEEMWENGLNEFGTNMEDISTKVIDFLLDKGNIDTVFITKMESDNPEDSHCKLITYCDNNNIDVIFQEYAYAMYRDPEDENIDQVYPMEKLNQTWTYGNRDYHDQKTDVLDIEDFHYRLKDVNKLYLAGAFEGECVNDQEKILDTIDAEYEKIDSLVVGTYVDYEFKGLNKIEDDLNLKVNEIEEFIDENFEENFDIDEMKKENPESFEKLFDLIEEFIDENRDELEIINFSLDIQYEIINESLDSEKYEEFDTYKDGLLDNIDDIKETNNLKINLEDAVFYQHSVLDLNKSDISLSKTYNIDADQWVQYFSSNEERETLEAQYKGIRENSIPVVFKIKDNFESVCEIDLNEVDIDDEITIYDTSITISDEQESCSTLIDNEFRSLLLLNNEDDNHEKFILLDSDHEIENFEVKAKVGNNWSEYMSPNELKTFLNDKNKNKRKSRQRI